MAEDQRNIQILFEADIPIYGHYSDALYLPEDHEFSESDIDAMKQERIDAWALSVKAVSEAPPVPVDIKMQINNITEQIEQLKAQKAELEIQLGG